MNSKLRISMVSILALGLIWAGGANAQLNVFNGNVPTGFDMLGIIQAATLARQNINTQNVADYGGTLTINGVTMIVPDNTVVQMPANTLKWSELFDPSVATKPVYDPSIVPAPLNLTITPLTSGLALMDNPTQAPGISPWLPFNAIVQGNIDVKGSTGKPPGSYIVGLILPISQDLASTGTGFISFIDYANGRFEVGGTLGVKNTGTILEINDPFGRFGLAHSPDPRFSVDSDNPTITTGNGYPMGLPKVAPAGGGLFPAPGEVGDPDRPYYNRPLNPPPGNAAHDPFLQTGAPLTAFTMPAKTAPNVTGVTTPDPWKQVPLMIGDYVSYSGIQCKLTPANALNTATPINRQTYISVNTIGIDKLAVYTAAGTVATAGPCYMQTARMVIGNGGGPVIVPANPLLGILGGVIPLPEPRRNIVIHGWVTDATQLIDIYAVDIVGGVEVPRLLGTVLPETGPLPAGARKAGNRGRFRFDVGKGNFLSATRVYMVKSRHGTVQVPNQTGNIVPPQGGLLSGQYHAPMFTFQFADAAPGFPNIPSNFNTMPFLFSGEGGNPSDGPLTPFPPFTP